MSQIKYNWESASHSLTSFLIIAYKTKLNMTLQNCEKNILF